MGGKKKKIRGTEGLRKLGLNLNNKSDMKRENKKERGRALRQQGAKKRLHSTVHEPGPPSYEEG